MAAEECFDDVKPFGDVEVELLLAEVIGVDERLDGRGRLDAELQGLAVQVDEEQRQRRNPLLAVDEIALPAAGGDDYRAQEVIAVLAGLPRLIAWPVGAVESSEEVGEQLLDVLRLPLVLALVLVDGEGSGLQQAGDLLLVGSWRTCHFSRPRVIYLSFFLGSCHLCRVAGLTGWPRSPLVGQPGRAFGKVDERSAEGTPYGDLRRPEVVPMSWAQGASYGTGWTSGHGTSYGLPWSRICQGSAGLMSWRR